MAQETMNAKLVRLLEHGRDSALRAVQYMPAESRPYTLRCAERYSREIEMVKQSMVAHKA